MISRKRAKCLLCGKRRIVNKGYCNGCENLVTIASGILIVSQLAAAMQSGELLALIKTVNDNHDPYQP